MGWLFFTYIHVIMPDTIQSTMILYAIIILIVLFVTYHTTLLPITLHLYRSRVHILVQTHA